VANGTDALTIALRAYGVGPGDEVVTVAYTFIASGEAILLNGATPVFVDVDPERFTMDPSRLEAAITKRTRLIVPVHLYGHPAAMAEILAVASAHSLPVLEDAAQAHGAELVRVKLARLDLWNAERRERVLAYQEGLSGIEGLRLPREHGGARSAWHLFTIRSDARDALRDFLTTEGIAVAVHYPRPIHLQPAMGQASGRPGDLPVSEQLSKEVLSLPLYPELPVPTLERVVEAVRAFHRG
jgi:dTDP-4-amino-4,6-dideoxygalactose transaminase